MSDTHDQSHLTVEDSGSTSDAGALANHGVGHAVGAHDADTAEPASAASRDTGSGLDALRDEDLGHVFDQTNGMIDRADGDSDGSAESDVLSGEERAEDDPMFDDVGVRGDGEEPETRRTGD